MLTQELKKIFRPWLVLAVLVLGAVYGVLFIGFYVQTYPTNIGGSNGAAILETVSDWVERFGPSLSPEEEAQLEAELPALYAEADGYIAADPTAQKHGLETYQDFLTFQQTANRSTGKDIEDLWRILDRLWSGETGNIEGRLYVYSFYTEQYRYFADGQRQEWLAEALAGGQLTQREYNNIMSTYFGPDGGFDSLLPQQLTAYHVSDCARRFTVLAVLALCLLLGPVMTGDRMSRMIPVQYASRRGRSLARTQLAAALLTGAAVAALTAGLFWVLFIRRHGLDVFFPCRLASFDYQYAWPDWTFGGYLAALGILHLAACLAAAALCWLISRTSGNYIAMLLKLIPVFAALDRALICLMDDAFYYANSLYKLTGLPYVEPLAMGALVLLAVALTGLLLRRLRRRDVPDV